MIGSQGCDKPFRGTLDEWTIVEYPPHGRVCLGISSESGKLRRTSLIVHIEYREQEEDKMYIETLNSIYELLNERHSN